MANTKEWLMRGYQINLEINRLENLKYKKFENACSCTACIGNERVNTSRNNGSENKFIQYTNISMELDQKIDEYIDIQNELKAVIKKMSDNTLQAILYMRYIQFRSWRDIAHKLNLHYRTVAYRLHSKAIKEISKKIA